MYNAAFDFGSIRMPEVSFCGIGTYDTLSIGAAKQLKKKQI